jgi:DNA end-binding protein Ku
MGKCCDFSTLRSHLKRTKRTGIAKVVIHSRQHLSALLPLGDALVLELLRFLEELREENEFALPAETLATYHISPKELEIAEQLVTAMSKKWTPEECRDDYRESLRQFIEEKEAGLPKAKKVAGKAVPRAKAIDFMELMKQSLEEKKGRAKSKRKK